MELAAWSRTKDLAIAKRLVVPNLVRMALLHEIGAATIHQSFACRASLSSWRTRHRTRWAWRSRSRAQCQKVSRFGLWAFEASSSGNTELLNIPACSQLTGSTDFLHAISKIGVQPSKGHQLLDRQGRSGEDQHSSSKSALGRGRATPAHCNTTENQSRSSTTPSRHHIRGLSHTDGRQQAV